MGPMQPAGNGQWVHMSPTGEPIQVFHLPHQDGISASSLKDHHSALKRVVSYMARPHHLTVEKVEAG